MAKEFDIFLKQHLTQCDLIVYSIPYRDSLSAANRLILETALHGYVLQKLAAVQMGSELSSHIDEMIKLCMEKLNMDTGLGASAEVKTYDKLLLIDNPLIIQAQTIQMMWRMLTEAENGLLLAVQPLETQLSLSSGRGSFPVTADALVADTLKRSLLNLRQAVVSGAAATASQTDFLHIDSPVAAGFSLGSLCYQMTVDAETAVEIAAIVLGAGIGRSLGAWYDSITLGSNETETWCHKFVAVQTVTSILQEASGKLIKLLYPDSSTVTVKIPDVDVCMSRYRLLSEMDDLTLEDFDDMTLKELDYVWLI